MGFTEAEVDAQEIVLSSVLDRDFVFPIDAEAACQFAARQADALATFANLWTTKRNLRVW